MIAVNKEQKLLTRTELAKKFKVHYCTIAKLDKNFGLPKIKVGKAYRYNFSEVSNFLKEK